MQGPQIFMRMSARDGRHERIARHMGGASFHGAYGVADIAAGVHRAAACGIRIAAGALILSAKKPAPVIRKIKSARAVAAPMVDTHDGKKARIRRAADGGTVTEKPPGGRQRS